jgi:hypothetical protein
MSDYILRVETRDGHTYQSMHDRDEGIALAAEARRHGDNATIQRECQGHDEGRGRTVYCDGSCQPIIRD